MLEQLAEWQFKQLNKRFVLSWDQITEVQKDCFREWAKECMVFIENTNMGKDYYTTYKPVNVYKNPELSVWECWLFGTGENGVCYTPAKGKEPNFFWRWMQYICFGCKWVKKK